jgi:hypothetical protein
MGDQAYGFGGGNWTYDGSHVNVYRYDLSDNAWTTMTSCTYTRANGESGGGGYIDGYVFGGRSGGDSPYGYKKVEKYSIADNSWTIKNDQPQNEGGGSRPEPVLGSIYCSNWKYAFAEDTWKGCPTVTGGLGAFGVSGIIYGCSYNNSWKYNPNTDSKAAITTIPTSSHEDSGAGWGNGTYGFISGGGSNPPTNRCDRYDPANDSWVQRASQGDSRGNNGSFVIGGKGHSFCGYTYPNSSSNYHGEYDNAGNSWTSKASYPQSWAGVSGFYPLANLPPNAPTNLSVSAT